ncbi:uncharacterized protein N7484_001767 [Penicillium longicatenatum]|uniref:uncharacterized protein n=1 Tax=Penicillium longicatenatum TaxID=1561947 RepID=UPI002546A6BA|nr:uncharacterized protein N7484_001767 [Penicillium longicatenatum]KAJ5658118.1 hypothetical protein N7484_001767 [Penicillium longicatenatum]KAJ5663801.1 hypothetical protein N7507_004532 [Penicillium longicatenatum]
MLLRQSTRLSTRLAGPIRDASSIRSWSSTASKLSEKKSAYREGLSAYGAFARPFGKVFLGAVLTYQIIYWSWMKLETDDIKLQKNEQLSGLEKKARELAAAQK